MIVSDILPNSTTITIIFCIDITSSIYLQSFIQFNLVFMQTISLLIFNLEFPFKFWCLKEKLLIFALTATTYPVFFESDRTVPK